MGNPFAVEAWDVSSAGGSADSFLGAGDHVVTVQEVDGTTTSSGGYPQIELRLGNESGSIRDWLVITPSTYGKIAQVIQALGVELPDAETEISQDDHRVAQGYLDGWIGKSVGVIARDEPAYNDPSKMRTRIKGYVSVDKITPAPASNGGDVQGQAFAPANSGIDADLPF
ncbi:hypothetical protein UFOVP1313_33 [uncultured Caudovirales phage]|uniref:Uncharacterized protein n=1 Tax=uncultured Caudovirales phage TaxID=2100421 RepID=A0A6J5RZI5_9CAUD|nr:hypothetical protein UFOVP1313_33 [uncultured Caudovirales phage]